MDFVVVVFFVIFLAVFLFAIFSQLQSRSRAETPGQELRPVPVRRSSPPPSEFRFDPGPTLRDGMNEDWRIRYVDRDGEETSRTITVLALHGETHPKYIFAFCHLRQDHRHFNVYNVQAATDAAGNKVPVTYQLLPWLDQRDLGTIGGRGEGSRVEHVLPEPVPVTMRNDTTGEVWDMQISTVLIRYGVPLVRGRATRRQTPHHRKWTGQKTFGHDPEDVICDPDTSDTWRNPLTHPDIARQIQD